MKCVKQDGISILELCLPPPSNMKFQICFTAKGMENQRYLEHKNNTTNTACMKSIGNVTLQVSEFWRQFLTFSASFIRGESLLGNGVEETKYVFTPNRITSSHNIKCTTACKRPPPYPGTLGEKERGKPGRKTKPKVTYQHHRTQTLEGVSHYN